MADSGDPREEAGVYQFILDQIDSVPHLEALTLLWNSRPQQWSAQDVAGRLYTSVEVAQNLLRDLARRELIGVISGPPDQFRYESRSAERDEIIGLVDATYRREIVRVSTMIHSKPSSAVRDFARAFRLKKDRE